MTAKLTKTLVGEWLGVIVSPVEPCVGGRCGEDIRGVGPVVVVRRLAVVGVGRTQAVVWLCRALQGGVHRRVSLVLILEISSCGNS